VEKIKRDAKIATIFEGTSEIQQSIISIFRLRNTIHTKGEFYRGMAKELSDLSKETNGPIVARAMELLNEFLLVARKLKVTKSQYFMFLLADMMTWVEVAKALCIKAGSKERETTHSNEFMLAVARLFAREAVEKVYMNIVKIIQANQQVFDDLTEKLNSLALTTIFEGALADMGVVARELTA